MCCAMEDKVWYGLDMGYRSYSQFRGGSIGSVFLRIS